MSQLWVEPEDLSARDLFHGIGNGTYAPDTSVTYVLEAVERGGYSVTYDVRDPEGREWAVKVGPESRTEVTASRILWAVGYHQPPAYYVRSWKLGHPDGTFSVEPGARFRPKLDTLDKIDEWSWQRNPFVGTRPYKGLIVLNAMLNNSDIKTPNNALYKAAEPFPGPSTWYVVRDVGQSFGTTGIFRGTRDDPEGFDSHRFITGVRNGHVLFEWRGLHDELLDDITPADVRWICERLARLTDEQWMEAFRAGGFEPDRAQRFITRMKLKIGEGLGLS
jgi:hypothetical protein